MKADYVHKDTLTATDYVELNKNNKLLISYNQTLLKENQELKKQLDYLRSEEYYNQLRFERDMLQNVVDNGEVPKEDKQFIDMTHRNTELLEQQKEFIEYLENEINKLKEQIKNYDIWHEVGTDINFLILKKQFYLEILQKYKEIIGVSDEKK